MEKPLLIVVTGAPASGKTTLARMIAGKINCPLLSRDELKEGLINTLQLTHSQLNRSVDLHVYETFFETIELLIAKKISIVIEAAFQDKLWRPKLLSLLEKAAIRIILCNTSVPLIKARFSNRLLQQPDREKFHGDRSINEEQFAALTENYTPVHIEAPTLLVDTTENYNPGLEEIIQFIRQ
jgi:predicted kinase